jgi:hypothetical protein
MCTSRLKKLWDKKKRELFVFTSRGVKFRILEGRRAGLVTGEFSENSRYFTETVWHDLVVEVSQKNYSSSLAAARILPA